MRYTHGNAMRAGVANAEGYEALNACTRPQSRYLNSGPVTRNNRNNDTPNTTAHAMTRCFMAQPLSDLTGFPELPLLLPAARIVPRRRCTFGNCHHLAVH